MLLLTRVPEKVYDFLFRFKPYFRCVQTSHFVLFCWLLVALCLESGKGSIKGLMRHLPERITYWSLMRFVRSGLWNERDLLEAMGFDVLSFLPPSMDSVIYLVGDLTLKGKRGDLNPLGRKARVNEHSRYCFGFEVLLLIACWSHYRVPIACVVLDPDKKREQNNHFRRLLRQARLPTWVKEVIVVADAGFASTKTFNQIEKQGFCYVFAVARTRKFEDGKSLRDFVRHLPKSNYRRVKTVKADGRRRDYWIYESRKSLHGIGDVTIVLSKQRRIASPKRTKIIVTNLKGVSASRILSIYARRWSVEITFKELKSGLHLGKMQVTRDKERVRRSVSLSVMAYLLLVRLYAKETYSTKSFSIFRFKQKFSEEVGKEVLNRTEEKWQRKLDKLRLVA
jgi:hypothetical protein